MVTGTVRGGWRGRSRNWKSLPVMGCSSCLRERHIAASPGSSSQRSPPSLMNNGGEGADAEGRYWIRAGSCRAPQFVGQRGQGRGLGLDQPELVLQPAEVAQDAFAPGASGVRYVSLDQPAQVLHVVLHALRRDAQQVDQLVVVAIDEVALDVQHVGEAAGHAGAEFEADLAQPHYYAAGHVLAAVVAGAFHHRQRAGVAHSEAFTGAPGGEQLAVGGAIQAGVAEDRRILAGE